MGTMAALASDLGESRCPFNTFSEFFLTKISENLKLAQVEVTATFPLNVVQRSVSMSERPVASVSRTRFFRGLLVYQFVGAGCFEWLAVSLWVEAATGHGSPAGDILILLNIA